MRALVKTVIGTRMADDGLVGEVPDGPNCVNCGTLLWHDRCGFECEKCGSHLWMLQRLSMLGFEALVMALADVSAPWNDPPAGRSCPRCEESMAVVRPPTSNGVTFGYRVDVCRACDVVWLDPGEFDELGLTSP